MPKKKANKKSLQNDYLRQREEFYQTHKYSRYLLGLLILSFAVYLGVQLQNISKRQYVMLQLLEEGISPELADL